MCLVLSRMPLVGMMELPRLNSASHLNSRMPWKTVEISFGFNSVYLADLICCLFLVFLSFLLFLVSFLPYRQSTYNKVSSFLDSRTGTGVQ